MIHDKIIIYYHTRNKKEFEIHDIFHHIKEDEYGNVESQEFLARKYSLENETENIYKYFCMLINNNGCRILLEYAKFLYNT